MKRTFTPRNIFTARFSTALFIVAMTFVIACKKDKPPKELKDFVQVNLVGNNDEYSPGRIDPLLVNAWGLTWSANGIAWIGSTFGHVSPVYDREGAQVRPHVAIPSPGAATGGLPTGTVFNGGAGFVLSNGQPARFLFVGLDGVLSGWNAGAGNNALLIKNNSATSVYTGLAIADNGGALHIYAADFRSRKIETWNSNFDPVNLPFKDPYLPHGYSPFNIQAVGTNLYVTYAKVGADGEDQAGPGNGFVSIFSTDGKFVRRFTSRGALNSPWGVAAAPDSFFVDTDMAGLAGGHGGHGKPGEFSGPIILVGNFGDGRINAYTEDGQHLGALRKHGRSIVIEGLWAISFAPTTSTIDQKRLYFTAGPDDEANGLFGYIIKE